MIPPGPVEMQEVPQPFPINGQAPPMSAATALLPAPGVPGQAPGFMQNGFVIPPKDLIGAGLQTGFSSNGLVQNGFQAGGGVMQSGFGPNSMGVVEVPIDSRATSLSGMLEGQPLLGGLSSQDPLRTAEASIAKVLKEDPDKLGEQDIMAFHDALYQRFTKKYGNRPEVQVLFQRTTGEAEARLLSAIQSGDEEAIRSFRGQEGFSWNFVYPPAQVRPGKDGVPVRALDGWCRTPLGLLVHPDDGILVRMLPNMSNAGRLQLIKELLRSGADPNFPPTYWANPGILACLAGDLDALKLLEDWGCDLTQKVEFGMQSRPEFSLVHAAALNGHHHILTYLHSKVPYDVFVGVDAEQSNALHLLLLHAKDMESAMYLLDMGCDGYAFNTQQQSPLSLAIEHLPEFASTLLNRKSRTENKWLGRDVYWFSFHGVVLPLTEDGGPLQARNSADGNLMSLEEMMLQHQRHDLLLTPLMKDLINIKWRSFGRHEYFKRLAPYFAFLVAMLVVSTAPPHSLVIKVALAVAVPLILFEAFHSCGSAHDMWGVIDKSNVVMSVLVTAYKIARMCNAPIPEDTRQAYILPAYALVSMLLQVTMTVRSLRIIVVDKYVGPMLIAVLKMVQDTMPWLVLLFVAVFGTMNAFFALVHADPDRDMSEEADFDYSYFNMLQALCLAASTMDASQLLAMPQSIPEGDLAMRIGAWFLFWTFTTVVVLMLLNLLIALYNTAYESVVQGQSEGSWAFLRLQLLVYMESSHRLPGVKAYYDELKQFDGRRSFAKI